MLARRLSESSATLKGLKFAAARYPDGGTKGENLVRFVLAVITLVIAALLVLLGLAQRTVFAPPDSVTSSVTTTSSAPVTIIPASALKIGRAHV